MCQRGVVSAILLPMKKTAHLKLYTAFAAVYFFSLNGIGALPQLGLNFLLKNQLQLTPAQMAYFQAVTLLAWVVKPLWGLISDCFPIAGSRRKSYLLLSSCVVMLSWIALAMTKNYTAGFLLLVFCICDMAYAFQDVVTDGLMVEAGQPLNLTGQFQSVQWSAVYIGMIITALWGGYLSDLTQTGKLPLQTVFAMTAVFPLVTGLIVAGLIQEPKRPEIQKEAGLELKQAIFHKDIWLLCLFLFLWNFSPSFGAPFFYYCVETLKFSGTFIGVLQAVASAGSLVGSILYGVYLVKIPMRKLLIISTFAGVAMTLSYFVYFMPSLISQAGLLKFLAVSSNFIFGAANAFILLALMNLAARTSPQYAGGTVFALIMSFYNLGLMGSSALGGFLFPMTGLKPLIIFSSVFSLFVLVVLPYLPIAESLTPLEQTIKNFFGFFRTGKSGEK